MRALALALAAAAAFLLFASPALAQDITGPARIIWGTIQKFAIAGAKHQGTTAYRAQVQSSYADYKRWLAQEMGVDAL